MLANANYVTQTEPVSIYAGALVHDIGKLFFTRRILRGATPLNAEERAIIWQHPALGAELAPNFGLVDYIDIIAQHHERFDGSGYPWGLRGSQISLAARVVAVADALEVMTTGRPYQPAKPLHTAIDELESLSGAQFCPQVIEGVAGGRYEFSCGFSYGMSANAASSAVLTSMPR
ncbi:MAG: HD domain-containing protein [Truepera sp.]|nr:HD domain-containing protein [Truepera sp.]